MIRRSATVTNETGLHARPASMFVKAAKKYDSDISIEIKENSINAKSIMAILSAGICSGTMIDIVTDGIDEDDAMTELIGLIDSRFGE